MKKQKLGGGGKTKKVEKLHKSGEVLLDQKIKIRKIGWGGWKLRNLVFTIEQWSRENELFRFEGQGSWQRSEQRVVGEKKEDEVVEKNRRKEKARIRLKIIKMETGLKKIKKEWFDSTKTLFHSFTFQSYSHFPISPILSQFLQNDSGIRTKNRD